MLNKIPKNDKTLLNLTLTSTILISHIWFLVIVFCPTTGDCERRNQLSDWSNIQKTRIQIINNIITINNCQSIDYYFPWSARRDNSFVSKTSSSQVNLCAQSRWLPFRIISFLACLLLLHFHSNELSHFPNNHHSTQHDRHTRHDWLLKAPRKWLH